ncbi:unnamed protein product, partial [Mesorhabditis belari]|uniref:Uncharacterized protein n=1 Tax=Mesorhabditis belari TaxID=2138241 RepID=A0AAF3ERH1_9BILA
MICSLNITDQEWRIFIWFLIDFDDSEETVLPIFPWFFWATLASSPPASTSGFFRQFFSSGNILSLYRTFSIRHMWDYEKKRRIYIANTINANTTTIAIVSGIFLTVGEF